jgi:hypothetical protein
LRDGFSAELFILELEHVSSINILPNLVAGVVQRRRISIYFSLATSLKRLGLALPGS